MPRSLPPSGLQAPTLPTAGFTALPWSGSHSPQGAAAQSHGAPRDREPRCRFGLEAWGCILGFRLACLPIRSWLHPRLQMAHGQSATHALCPHARFGLFDLTHLPKTFRASRESRTAPRLRRRRSAQLISIDFYVSQFISVDFH